MTTIMVFVVPPGGQKIWRYFFAFFAGLAGAFGFATFAFFAATTTVFFGASTGLARGASLILGAGSGFSLTATFAGASAFFASLSAGAADGTARPSIIAAIRGEIPLARFSSDPPLPRKAWTSSALLQISALPDETRIGPLISAGCSAIAVQNSFSLMKRSSS